MEIKNIKLTLEYVGTNYSGWQTQAGAANGVNAGMAHPLTIQETIEGGISRLTGEEVKLIAAGRTDAGVHALGQVASFKTATRHDESTIKKALNATLPPDIRVIEASEADISFHARYSAIGKRYSYIIKAGGGHSAFLKDFSWAVPYGLDLDEMRRAAECFLGKRDFSAMRGAGCGARTTVREVTSLNIEPMDGMSFLSFNLKGDFIKISVEADAFLRHMVRNIAGTLVEVGRGRVASGSIPEILSSCDRKLAGPTAPAQGLFLEWVKYQKEPEQRGEA